MNGAFRATGHGTAAARRPQGVVERVVASLKGGMSVSQCAQAMRLPRDFVEQIVEHARAAGSLDVVVLDYRNGCGSGACDPDPSSLVCAGCPLAPAGAAHRIGIRAALRRLGRH